MVKLFRIRLMKVTRHMATKDNSTKRSGIGDAIKERLGDNRLLRKIAWRSFSLALLFAWLIFSPPHVFAQSPNKEIDSSTREASEKQSSETDFMNGVGISACSNGAYHFFEAEVISVLSGDQIVVAIRDETTEDQFAPQVTVQLVGIESSHQSALLEEAREHLAALVLGKSVRVTFSTRKLNSADRVVGKIITDANEIDESDRTDAGLQQIKAGFARYKNYGPYTLGRCDLNEYLKAEAEAKKAQRGIWKIKG